MKLRTVVYDDDFKRQLREPSTFVGNSVCNCCGGHFNTKLNNGININISNESINTDSFNRWTESVTLKDGTILNIEHVK